MATNNVKIGADSSRVGLAIKEEVDFAEFPGGPLQEARFTQESLAQQTDSTSSSEIRADRQIPDIIRTGISATGGFNAELSYGDAALEMGIRGVLGSPAPFGAPPPRIGPSDLDAQSSDNTFRAAGLDLSALAPGDWIRTSGFANAANNGFFQVIAVDAADPAANFITVEGGALKDEMGDGDESIQGSAVIRNGVADCAYSFAKQFNDLNGGAGLEARILGYRFGSTTIDLNPRSIVTVQFTGQGVRLADTANSDFSDSNAVLDFTGMSALTAASANEVMQTTSGIAGLILNRADPIAATPQSLSINPTSSLRNQDALQVGLGPAGIAAGQFSVTGTLAAFFENPKLLREHLLFNDVDIAVVAKDGAGNAYLFDLPAVRLGGSGTPSAGGNDQDVITSFDIQAKRSTRAGLDYMFALHKFPA